MEGSAPVAKWTRERAERLGLHAQVLYCGRVCPGSQVDQRERAERLGLHAQVLYCGRVCPGSQADQREQRDWAYMHRYFIVEGSAPVAKRTRESRETGPTCTGTLLWKGLPR